MKTSVKKLTKIAKDAMNPNTFSGTQIAYDAATGASLYMHLLVIDDRHQASYYIYTNLTDVTWITDIKLLSEAVKIYNSYCYKS